jgi:2-polyprenyl-3-methyl-5-hydroxy-6-metoxy-1,4-benzoquinol methylase
MSTSAQTLSQEWPSTDLEQVESCPVCRSERRDILHRGLRDQIFFCAPGTWELYRCLDCDSAYLNPRPTAASIGRAYSSYFTHSGQWREPAEELPPLRRLLRSFSNGFFNQRFGTSFTPATSLGYWIAQAMPWKKAELEVVGRHLPRPRPSQTLLDVGCGNGIFLEFARQAGWQASGVDFDEDAVACCLQKGLDVRQGGIEVLTDRAGYFDWITLSHVIEHVHDPLALLVVCQRLLKPGGGLWIETPNIQSQGHREFGAAWRGLEPPRHLVLFNRGSLKQALHAAGFQEVLDAPFRPSYQWIALQSQAIDEHKNPYEASAKKRYSLHDISADYMAWGKPDIREFITFIARKPA